MGIGAISGFGAVSYNPYIYNSNSVSSASLNKIKSIPDDATQGGVDYTSAISESAQENINQQLALKLLT